MKKSLHAIGGLCIALSLVGCGSGGDNADTASTPGAVGPDATTPVQKTLTVAELEQQGKLPKLDRSSSLKGPDADNNGVRDDIDLWIQAQPYSPTQKQSALQLAKALQNTLTVDTTNDAALRSAQDQSRKAVTCIYGRFPSDVQPNPNTVIKTLQKYTMNTKERVIAYIAYNEALSGSVNGMPSGDTCA